ncbi:MAG: hypothetical protein IKU39_03220 [Lachnospiraceae bacterium]|nr:hypothetical protein [Lachnospiraceae bacterium]
MKKVIIAMVIMFVLIVPFGGVWGILLQPIIGGGVEQTFLYPIYAGLVLLTGLIVGCTVIILEEIRSLKK